MVSARKLAANRANAKRSTGPRSREGKAHAAANACRHGLATSVLADAALRGEVKDLARKIMTSFGDEAELEMAQRVAEAQIDLTRVRQARHDLIQRALLNPRLISAKQTTEFYVLMARGMELSDSDNSRRALAILERASAVCNPPEEEAAAEHEARRLADFAQELAALDRYERRALSRCKFAIRELDAALMSTPRSL